MPPHPHAVANATQRRIVASSFAASAVDGLSMTQSACGPLAHRRPPWTALDAADLCDTYRAVCVSRRYEYVTRADRLAHIAQEIAEAEVIALDLETTPKPEWARRPGAAFSPLYGRTRLVSINTGKGVYVIDVWQTGGLGPIRDALHNPNAQTGKGRPVVVGQNVKFDQRYLLHEYGVELWPVFDTFRASAMIYNGKGLGHNLWDLYERELHMKPQTGDLGGSNWGNPVLTEEQLDYAADDVIHLPHLREVLRPKLARLGMNRVALIEFGAILPEAACELNGFAFDPDAWLALAADNRKRRDDLGRELLRILPNPSGQLALLGSEDWMYGPDVLSGWADSMEAELEAAEGDDGSAGFSATWSELQAQLRRAAKPRGSKKSAHFNLDAQGQLLASLRKMGGPLANLPDTAESSLAVHAATMPAIKRLIEYREAATRCKSFGPDYLQHVSPVTGRIHLDYYPLLVTGRYAHRNPNLGQIPRDKRFRKCFRVAKGRKLTLCDYSMIEIVLMAELTQDPTLVRLLRANKDIHRYVASKIAGKPESEVTKEERQQAKPADFGFIYGLGAERFLTYALVGYGVALTLEQSTHIRNTFFEEFPVLADWQRLTIASGKRTRTSRSILGRIRFTDEQTHNEYLNHPDQSSGADGLKMALRDLHFALRNKFGPDAVKLVHHVHDETIVEHPDDPEIERDVQKLQSDVMVEAMSRIVKSVPVKAEPASGYSWADKG